MNNHSRRVERVIARLSYNHFDFTHTNDLFGKTTSIYVQTAQGEITIVIRLPSLQTQAFEIVRESDTFGFSTSFTLTQTDLLELIDDLEPTDFNNVVSIR